MKTTERERATDALVSATIHMVGQTRAFVQLVEGLQREIGNVNDDRAASVLESMGATLRERTRPGTLCNLEWLASELLRRVRAESER